MNKTMLQRVLGLALTLILTLIQLHPNSNFKISLILTLKSNLKFYHTKTWISLLLLFRVKFSDIDQMWALVNRAQNVIYRWALKGLHS